MLLHLVELSSTAPSSTPLRRLLPQGGILFVSLGLCLGLLNGCFLWHVSVGQLKLLARRQPVEEVLSQATLSEQEQHKLRLIMRVRLFATEQLGLHVDDSYTTFVDVGGPYVTYNVSAAPKDALRPYVWWFPIVGRVPYKGYFNKDAALRQAHKLEARGYDTYVRGVRAYSTLGYFDDPILSSMLAYPDFALIDTIIHELVHRTVWVKGSVSFNESLASFVADKGVQAYLAAQHGADAPPSRLYQDLQADAQVFRSYMHGVVQRLETLYQGPLSRAEKLRQREQIFAAAVSDYPSVFPRMKTKRYRRYFERRTLNNAVLLSFRRYNRDMSFFERAFAAHGGDIRRLIDFFKTLRPGDIPETFRT
jgi:predicted aminopeptidase